MRGTALALLALVLVLGACGRYGPPQRTRPAPPPPAEAPETEEPEREQEP